MAEFAWPSARPAGAGAGAHLSLGRDVSAGFL